MALHYFKDIVQTSMFIFIHSLNFQAYVPSDLNEFSLAPILSSVSKSMFFCTYSFIPQTYVECSFNLSLLVISTFLISFMKPFLTLQLVKLFTAEFLYRIYRLYITHQHCFTVWHYWSSIFLLRSQIFFRPCYLFFNLFLVVPLLSSTVTPHIYVDSCFLKKNDKTS